jgi:hypothetical protein
VVVQAAVVNMAAAVARAAYPNQQFICLLTQLLLLVQVVLAVQGFLRLVHHQVLTTPRAR